MGGRDMSTEDVASIKSKDGLFVDKYRDCSLAPLFDAFVTRLKGDIGRIQ
jgi:hypothetical protein